MTISDRLRRLFPGMRPRDVAEYVAWISEQFKATGTSEADYLDQELRDAAVRRAPLPSVKT